MLSKCPICEGQSNAPIYQAIDFPIFSIIPANEPITRDHFGSLEIVRCLDCMHMFNRGFDAGIVERMYRDFALTNVPVNGMISKILEDVVTWIGPSNYECKRVLDVGGGSGHLARLLAKKAAVVTILEPSTSLDKADFSESNIDVLNSTLDSASSLECADLVVCRQVLEHVPDPYKMLRQLRNRLTQDGKLYLEVPRAEFIEEHSALSDLHYAHVQYFHEENLLALTKKAGFELIRLWRPINDHELGLLLKPINKEVSPDDWEVPCISHDLHLALIEWKKEFGSVIASTSGETLLYGASWHAVAFLSNFGLSAAFTAALDDNELLHKGILYSLKHRIDVCVPSKEILDSANVVVLTAYLHQRNIRNRLTQLGYKGTVITPQPNGFDPCK